MSGNVTSGSAETQWIDAVLKDLGAPQSTNNVNFLKKWIAVENDQYGFNPLGTTYNSNGKIGHYSSLQAGASATANTLKLGIGGYPSIIAGLKGSKPLSYYTTGAGKYGLLTWDPGGGDLKKLGGAIPSTYAKQSGTTPSTPVSSTPTANTGILMMLNGLLNPESPGLATSILTLGMADIQQVLETVFFRGVVAILGLMIFYVGLQGVGKVASQVKSAGTDAVGTAAFALPVAGQAAVAEKAGKVTEKIKNKLAKN